MILTKTTGITFDEGDPRFKYNLNRVRRHMSQIAKDIAAEAYKRGIY